MIYRACLCSLCQSFELFRIRTKTFITMWIILTLQTFQMCHPAKNMSKMQNCELAVAHGGATNGASVHCDSLRLVLRAFESAKINSMAQRQVGINLAELWNLERFWSVTLSKHVASLRNKMLVKERPFLEAAYSMKNRTLRNEEKKGKVWTAAQTLCPNLSPDIDQITMCQAIIYHVWKKYKADCPDLSRSVICRNSRWKEKQRHGAVLKFVGADLLHQANASTFIAWDAENVSPSHR